MGQKTHPIGFRLGIIKTWDSRWFAGKNYANLLEEDIKIRRYLENRLSGASLSKVVIQRAVNKVTINIATAKPGLVIGRRGTQVDQLRDELKHLTGKDFLGEDASPAFVGDDVGPHGRQITLEVLVGVVLVAQAALQPSAAAGDFAGVERGTLQLGHLH